MAQRHPDHALPANHQTTTALPTGRPPIPVAQRQSQWHSAAQTTPCPPITSAQRHRQRCPHSATPQTTLSPATPAALPTGRPPHQSQRHSATQTTLCHQSPWHSDAHTTPSPPITTAQRRRTPTRQPRYSPILTAQRIGRTAKARERARGNISKIETNRVPPPDPQTKTRALRYAFGKTMQE